MLREIRQGISKLEINTWRLANIAINKIEDTLTKIGVKYDNLEITNLSNQGSKLNSDILKGDIAGKMASIRNFLKFSGAELFIEYKIGLKNDPGFGIHLVVADSKAGGSTGISSQLVYFMHINNLDKVIGRANYGNGVMVFMYPI